MKGSTFLWVAFAAVSLVVGCQPANASDKIIYFTSFEYDVPSVGGPEWQLPPRHPWAQNSNDPMNRVNFGRTGNRSMSQADTFSQWSMMKDIGADLVDDFYVKAWVNFGPERERFVNPNIPPCDCAAQGGPPTYWRNYTDTTVYSGTITGADDGGQTIPGWNPCRLTQPSITDENQFFWNLKGNSTLQPFTLSLLTGDAVGTEWLVDLPIYYTCGGAPFGYVPDEIWGSYNHRIPVKPKLPNTLGPVAGGIEIGDEYTIRGAVAPQYRAIQIWLENKDLKDFAKFGIWHRYSGDPPCTNGEASILCRDSNNWKFWNRNGGTVVNQYYGNPWVDTGIHRGYNFTGWHSLEIRVYGDNPNPDKHQQFHFLVDGQVVGKASRYTDEGPVALNRIQMGGLAVSQESAQWDDIEVGFLPEGPSVTTLNSFADFQNAENGQWVKLPNAVVQRAGVGWFILESPLGGTGIRCEYTASYTDVRYSFRPGDVVEPVGMVVDNGCERYLKATKPALVARGAPVTKPYLAKHRDLRSNTPSMMGRYVGTWGRVTDMGDFQTYFRIDDASDPSSTEGLKVYIDMNVSGIFILEQWVLVKGVLSCADGEVVLTVADPEYDAEVLIF